MQLLGVILLGVCLQATAAAHTQGIRLELKDASLTAAFDEITRQTGTHFLYTEDIIKGARPVSVSIQNGTLKEVLDLCLYNQPLNWESINETIVISRKFQLPKIPQDSTKKIRGTVTANGLPVSGVSVVVKGTHKGTVTNSEGVFEISEVVVPATLVVSSIGYREVVTKTDGAAPLLISLEIVASKLDETVVIGYGTTTKRLNTGSVAKVTNEDVEIQPVSNALQAMQGRVSGLMITQNTGLPGGDFQIQLRGRNSIRTASNELLYIVDGVPFPSVSLHGSTESANGAVHPLNSISPQDIQSIEVLKDADATAIYGSRGANGVILITTKKGLKGAPAVTFNYYKGWGKIARKLEVMNTSQYLSMRREAFSNDGAVPSPTRDFDLTEWDSTRSNDWQKELIGGTAHMTNAGVSYSGGSASTQFLLGTNYYRETTVLPGNFNDQKKSVLLNITHKAFNNRLDITFSANYMKQEAALFKRDITRSAYVLAPNTPALADMENGKVLYPNNINSNPYTLLFQPYHLETSNLIASINLKYALTKELELSANSGYTKMNLEEMNQTPLRSLNLVRSPNSTGGMTMGHGMVETFITEPQVKWRKQFGRHDISVMTGLTFQQSISDKQTIRGSGFTSDDLLENILAAASTQILRNEHTKYKYSSSYSRISYVLNNRYLVNLTGRTDASSRFGPGKRLANFGAAGIGWIFSNETFMKNGLPFLSYGKLRGSYGTTGNDQIGDYEFLDRWAPTSYVYLGITGLQPQNLKNNQYSWETNKKLEFALETGWLKDRITTSVAWYRNRSSNQLIGYVLSGTTGFEFIQDNFPATVENTGWEIELTATLINRKNLSWTIDGNLTLPKNKLVAFPGMESSPYRHVYEIGRSLYARKLYHFTGMDPATGVYQFEDVNKDGNMSYPEDITFNKEVAQQYFGAVGTKLTVKQFELDALFQFVKQTGLNYIGAFSAAGMMGNQPVFVQDRWMKPGDIAMNQVYTQSVSSDAYAAFSNAGNLGDNMIDDASFVRLKNIQLSYTLASSALNKAGLKGLNVFVRAQNLLTFTNYKGLDPENQTIGRLPPLKVIAAGVQVRL